MFESRAKTSRLANTSITTRSTSSLSFRVPVGSESAWDCGFLGTRELLREFPKKAAYSSEAYGRGGVGRGVGETVGVALTLGVAVTVAVAVGDGLAAHTDSRGN